MLIIFITIVNLILFKEYYQRKIENEQYDMISINNK